MFQSLSESSATKAVTACVQKSPSAVELIGYYLEAFLEQNDLGVTAGAGGMMRLALGLVRIPDVSFVSWEQLPGRDLPAEPIPDLFPDLAVEVLSESNTAGEMKRKLREYFKAGTRLVWLVDAKTRTVAVYTSPTKSKNLGENQSLDGSKVLPGFPGRALLDKRRPPQPRFHAPRRRPRLYDGLYPLEEHQEGILNYYVYPISTGPATASCYGMYSEPRPSN
jgi:hypothetical protein